MGSRPVDPQPGPGAAPPSGLAGAPGPEGEPVPGPLPLQPTQAEMEEWAARERSRREAWLNGPTPEERERWARQERARRLAALAQAAPTEAQQAQARERERSMREAQLAAEGALALFWKWSRRGLDLLVDAGREWERSPAQPGRRRVPLDEDPPPGQVGRRPEA